MVPIIFSLNIYVAVHYYLLLNLYLQCFADISSDYVPYFGFVVVVVVQGKFINCMSSSIVFFSLEGLDLFDHTATPPKYYIKCVKPHQMFCKNKIIGTEMFISLIRTI